MRSLFALFLSTICVLSSSPTVPEKPHLRRLSGDSDPTLDDGSNNNDDYASGNGDSVFEKGGLKMKDNTDGADSGTRKSTTVSTDKPKSVTTTSTTTTPTTVSTDKPKSVTTTKAPQYESTQAPKGNTSTNSTNSSGKVEGLSATSATGKVYTQVAGGSTYSGTGQVVTQLAGASTTTISRGGVVSVVAGQGGKSDGNWGGKSDGSDMADQADTSDSSDAADGSDATAAGGSYVRSSTSGGSVSVNKAGYEKVGQGTGYKDAADGSDSYTTSYTTLVGFQTQWMYSASMWANWAGVRQIGCDPCSRCNNQLTVLNMQFKYGQDNGFIRVLSSVKDKVTKEFIKLGEGYVNALPDGVFGVMAPVGRATLGKAIMVCLFNKVPTEEFSCDNSKAVITIPTNCDEEIREKDFPFMTRSGKADEMVKVLGGCSVQSGMTMRGSCNNNVPVRTTALPVYTNG
eukprot:g33748.t1